MIAALAFCRYACIDVDLSRTITTSFSQKGWVSLYHGLKFRKMEHESELNNGWRKENHKTEILIQRIALRQLRIQNGQSINFPNRAKLNHMAVVTKDTRTNFTQFCPPLDQLLDPLMRHEKNKKDCKQLQNTCVEGRSQTHKTVYQALRS